MSDKAKGSLASSFVRVSGSGLRAAASKTLSYTIKPSFPGLGEMEEAVKVCINRAKMQGYDDEEYQQLSKRIEGLLSVVQSFDPSQNSRVSAIAEELNDICKTLEESNNMVEATLVGAMHVLLCIRQDECQKRSIDAFPVIDAHEITDQTILRPSAVTGTSRMNFGYPECGHSVSTCTRHGYYGNIQVIYRTYTSQAVEEDLKHLSKYLHPNVASVVGVTKGYYGLNGVAVVGKLQTHCIECYVCLWRHDYVSGGIPLDSFFSLVNDGATFAKFARGLEEVANSGLLDHPDMVSPVTYVFESIACEQGNFVAVPTREPWGTAIWGPLVWHGFNSVDTTTNPAVDIALEVLAKASSTQHPKIIDAINTLDRSTFTELGVARIAAELGLAPCVW
ncbi:hypothetical protein RhiLY_07994 [Ceratobasidium sp. AG-Ba]|nr:hypothetical protein RhiLY_07994 [Ceratobasidium sp. AG-Ba]